MARSTVIDETGACCDPKARSEVRGVNASSEIVAVLELDAPEVVRKSVWC